MVQTYIMIRMHLSSRANGREGMLDFEPDDPAYALPTQSNNAPLLPI
ncbi:hypothetical protein [Leptolyngbya sp. BC1307]|nr:hypothetical protein [Leptolyngbya sp. BC1307]